MSQKALIIGLAILVSLTSALKNGDVCTGDGSHCDGSGSIYDCKYGAVYDHHKCSDVTSCPGHTVFCYAGGGPGKAQCKCSNSS